MRPRSALMLAGSGLAAGLLMPAVAAAEQADVCLEVAPAVLSAPEQAALLASVVEAVEARTDMFPVPLVMNEASRIDIWAGHADAAPGTGAPCLEPGSEWSARFSREFLGAGADQMLAEAPTTPGIDSSVDIEWFPDEQRLRTTLVFAGPFDFPNGTCWVDDTFSLDAVTGLPVASGEQGVKTSPFAEGACRRFFDHLPDGGAGEQALTLLPSVVELADGNVLRFATEVLDVREDALVMAGSLERD